MKSRNLIVGAVSLLGLGLILNAIALMWPPSPRTAAPPFVTQAAANLPGDSTPGVYYLGRSTLFMTYSDDGADVYLWYYDHDPVRYSDSEIKFVKSISAK